jgi:hypothetical protein
VTNKKHKHHFQPIQSTAKSKVLPFAQKGLKTHFAANTLCSNEMIQVFE